MKYLTTLGRVNFKYIFAAAAIGLLLFLIFAPASHAAPLTSAEQTQVAALYSKLDTLKRMLEIIANNLYRGGFAQVSGSLCSSSLIALLGDGCHQMYTDSSGSTVYCDGPMTKSAKAGDTATTSGCSSGGGTGSTSCGTGYYWYTPPSGGGYCQPNTTTSTSCASGYYWYVPPSGGSGYCQSTSTTNCPSGQYWNGTACVSSGTTTTTDCSVYGSGWHTMSDGNCYDSAMQNYRTANGTLYSCIATPASGCSSSYTTTTAPPTPTGFTASVSGTSITLRWIDVSGETQYKIWRQQNGNWSYLSSVGANINSYVDTVSAGTYNYYLKACNGEICSTPDTTLSGPVTVSPADTIPPSIPTGLVVSATASNRVDLTWIASTDNVAVTGYRIFRNNVSWATTGAVLNYFDSAVTPATTYTYAVSALDAAGNESPPSGSISVTTPSAGGTTATTTTTTSCSAYGSGWHSMDASGNCFDPAMTSYRTANGTLYSCNTTPTSGCTSTTSSCAAGYYWYVPPSGGAGSCQPNTTPTSPTGQKQQIWNSLGLQSYIRSDADQTRIDSLKQACSLVSNGANIWLPNAGNSASLDFGMPDSAKCQRAAICTASQYFDGASCVASTYNATCPSGQYWYVPPGGSAGYCKATSTTDCTSGQYWNGTACVSSTTTYQGDANSCPGFAYSRWDSSGRRYCQLNNTASCDYNYPSYLTNGANYKPENCPASGTTSTIPTGQREQIWNSLGLRSYIRSDADQTRIDSLKQSCTNVQSGANIWLPNAGNSASLDFGMPDSAKCQRAASCTASQYFDGASCVASTYNATCPSGQYWYVPPAGGAGYCTTSVVNPPPIDNYSCDAALTALLGTGCHYMFSDNSGNSTFCDAPMTKSARRGDTATTIGCQQGTNSQTTSTVFSVDTYSTYPRDGENGVSSLARIRVKFTKEIDLASTVAQFFSLATISSPNSSLNGSFQFLGDNFEFMPSAPLQSGTTYVYKVLTTLKDKSGAVLSAPFSATFNTSGGTDTSLAVIEGSVKDVYAQPLASAPIQIFKSDFSSNFGAVSAADGSFRATVTPGIYVIEVYSPYGRSDLLRPTPSKVTVAAGATQKIALQFSAVSSVTKAILGKIKFSNGDPVTDAEVGAYSSETHQWSSATPDSTGNYTLRVGGGNWTISVRPKNPATASWSFSGLFSEVSFARDNSSDFRTVDLVVPLADATLKVSTVDTEDKPLANVGVVVDTFSAGSAVSGDARSSPKFKSSDSSGIATFSLTSGRYYVRSYLPPDRGYLNSAEQEATAVGGKTVEVKLVFGKRNTVSTLLFKGTVKLEDGTPTDAFVWGWSERGGYFSAFSSEKGVFELKVGSNERWHVGAGKVVGNIPYKALETVVEVKNDPVAVELILVKLSRESLPPPVVIREDSAKQIIAQAEDGAKAIVPPNATGSSGNISVEVKPTIEAPSQAAAQVVSTVYDVSIHDSVGKSVSTLNSDVEITIPYDEAELKAKGVSEDGLIPSFFDEKTGTWVKVDNFTIDKVKKVVILRVNHLTRFTLVAPSDTTPPAIPTGINASALGEGKIKITWLNPSKDFAYAKVYRSLKSGELGQILKAEAKGTVFTDDAAVDGMTYYYTVRAVDPAGNESGNKEQVNVVAKGTAVKKLVGPSAKAGKSTLPAQATKKTISRNLGQGASGEDVKALQALLIKEGVYPGGSITGFYGKLTKEALIRFQEKYAKEILAPAGLSKGNGFLGTGTRKKINELLIR